MRSITTLNILLREYKTIFFLVGKAANSSIKVAIKQMQGQGRPYHSGHEYIDACKAHQLKGFHKIAVVRNPWARFVSCYYQKIVGPKPAFLTKLDGIHKGMLFEDFVHAVGRLPKRLQGREQHIRPQTVSMMCGDEFVPNWIIKLENIESEWKRLQEIIPISDLVPRNTTEHPPYRELYTEKTKRIIARRYAQDIEILNYQF